MYDSLDDSQPDPTNILRSNTSPWYSTRAASTVGSRESRVGSRGLRVESREWRVESHKAIPCARRAGVYIPITLNDSDMVHAPRQIAVALAKNSNAFTPLENHSIRKRALPYKVRTLMHNVWLSTPKWMRTLPDQKNPSTRKELPHRPQSTIKRPWKCSI